MRWIVLIVAVLSSAASADSWAPPSKQTYISPDKSVRLIVVPRSLKSALSYYEDKVAGREPAGAPAGSNATTGVATLQARDPAGRWVTKWTKPIVNEIAPVEVLVANSGEFVTFDNWASMGYGGNVVVVYSSGGKPVRKFGLGDLFPDWFAAALPHSVSSIWWRGTPRISADGTEVVVPVKLPTTKEDASGLDGATLDLRIRLSDGKPLGLQEEAWHSALGQSAAAAREMCSKQLSYIAKWNSPIASPGVWDEQSWHEYLRELYYRTASMVDGDFPAAVQTTVLRPPSAPDFQPSVNWLKEALTEKTNIPDFDVRAIGSPDFERLTEEIESIAAKVRPNQLVGVELIVVVDPTRAERIKAALARSGAKIRLVDPLEKFSQRPERLQKDDLVEMPVCQAAAAPQ